MNSVFWDSISLVFLAMSTLIFQLLGVFLLFVLLGKRNASFSKHISHSSEIWAWGRVVGWLFVGLVIWVIAHFFPLNTPLVFWMILLLSLTVFLLSGSLRHQLRSFVFSQRKTILCYELVFILGFVFLGLVRTYNPHVLDLEKFMDAGLMQRYVTSPKLPIEDMWLAGETVNYYTFGHFLGSLMLHFWLVPVEWGYNPLLAYILGLMCIESFALARLLLRPFLISSQKSTRKNETKNHGWLLIFVGIVAVLLVNFGGNSHPIWYLLKNHTFEKYWYPDATRFIDRTIHEFPAYSYIVSDLHAHVWSMPIVLLFLFLSWQWAQSVEQEKWKREAITQNGIFSFVKKTTLKSLCIRIAFLLGLLLGVLAMTSTWDMMIYGVFLAILGVSLLFVFTEKWGLLFLSGTAATVGMVVTAFLWWWNFTSISQGVFWATEHSPLWQLCVLWGGHFLLSVIALVCARIFYRRFTLPSSPFLFLVSMGITAAVLLVLPEVIYFKDIYPNHPRANTMFKFTFQAFILMSFLVSWLMAFVIQKKNPVTSWLRVLIFGAAFLFFLTVMTYPFLGYKSYYGQFQKREGSNGLVWLIKENPADYEALIWLRKEAQFPAVVLEAVGESYTKKARVSTFTGIPTVLGWRVHEWLWRGGFTIPGQRTEEVKTMYERPFSAEAQALFKKYKVRYIFIGSEEKATYTLNAIDLMQLGEIVYSHNGVFIIQRSL